MRCDPPPAAWLEVEAEAGSRAGEEAEAKTKPLRLSVAYVALDYFLEWVLGATARSVLKEPVVVLAQTIRFTAIGSRWSAI